MCLQIKVLNSLSYPSSDGVSVWIQEDTILNAEMAGTVQTPLYLIQYLGHQVVLFQDEVQVFPDGVQDRRYVYILVRADLEPADIMVQAAHAAYESAKEFPHDAERTSIIVLTVKTKYHLSDAVTRLRGLGISSTIYNENTKKLGSTALSTEAITEDQRKHMRKYKLLKVQ